MELLILLLILFLLIFILYFQFKNKSNSELNLNEKFKDELNSIKTSFSDSFGAMTKDIAKDMSTTMAKVDEKAVAFNQQVEALNKGQQDFSRILSGVKQFGVLAEFSLASLISDLLSASQYIANVKIKPEETNETVEFAIKLQDGVLCPIDSHWPIEKFKAINDAFEAKDKQMLLEARKILASAFKNKAKEVKNKYLSPPKTTDFAIVYAPTEGLFAELASYRDPNTKELLTQELMKKYKVTICGPNTLSAFLQSLYMGFQSLKVQKHATQIHDDLKKVSTRFEKHFSGIINLRKKLEEALKYTDDFGKDARSIRNTLENIKDPEQVEEAIKEDIDKIKVLNK